MPKVVINHEKVAQIAAYLKTIPLPQSLNFYSFYGKDGAEIVARDMYPSLNHKLAPEFFMVACCQQYGFWESDEQGYVKPLVARYNDGKESKGSDFLWKLLVSALEYCPSSFTPHGLASLSRYRFDVIFAASDGSIPFVDPDTRYQILRDMGAWLVDNNTSIKKIIAKANKYKRPLPQFLKLIRNIPGYNQDPFEKKNNLLAMALGNRPERFLSNLVGLKPIIDYHVQRLAERLGMIVIMDDALRLRLEQRQWISSEDEFEIRFAVYHAMVMLGELSHIPTTILDVVLWTGRKYCPEMTEPECSKCIFDSVCSKHTKLFQPVFRTTAY